MQRHRERREEESVEGTQVETIRGKDEEADEARRGTGLPCPYNREDRLCRDGVQRCCTPTWRPSSVAVLGAGLTVHSPRLQRADMSGCAT